MYFVQMQPSVLFLISLKFSVLFTVLWLRWCHCLPYFRGAESRSKILFPALSSRPKLNIRKSLLKNALQKWMAENSGFFSVSLLQVIMSTTFVHGYVVWSSAMHSIRFWKQCWMAHITHNRENSQINKKRKHNPAFQLA